MVRSSIIESTKARVYYSKRSKMVRVGDKNDCQQEEVIEDDSIEKPNTLR